DDVARGLRVDPAGNVYTTGSFTDAVDFNPRDGNYTLRSAGASDAFLSKLDSGGNFVWATQLGGSGTDIGRGLALDASNRVYSTGEFQGSNVDFDPADTTFNLSSVGDSDAYVWQLKQKSPPVVTLSGVPTAAVSEGTVLALAASVTDPDSTHVG